MNKPNILFLMIDSFGADKCVGNNKTSLTPNIDKLIQNGVYFSQAISVSDGTAPSWGSLFTSLYPFRSGVRGEIPSRLKPNITNMVDVLKKIGYHAYGFIPDYANAIGLAEPFENSDKSYAGYDPLSNGVGEKIIKLLTENANSPWFIFAHFLDLHWPFAAPQEFQSEKYGNTQYDKSMSFIDTWVGKILEHVQLDNTLVILSADHGGFPPVIYRNNSVLSFEGGVSYKVFNPKQRHKIPSVLYPFAQKIYRIQDKFKKRVLRSQLKKMNLTIREKRILSYEADFEGFDNNIYDDSIRIPLLISGCIKKHMMISQQVCSIDIFPTIFELVGIEIPQKIDGRSLVPLIEEKTLEEAPIYIESNHRNKSGQYLIGIRTSQFKYCREKDNHDKTFLADLQNDPFEEKNIAKERQDVTIQMENMLTNILGDFVINLKEKQDSNQRKLVEEELKKLGYI